MWAAAVVVTLWAVGFAVAGWWVLLVGLYRATHRAEEEQR